MSEQPAARSVLGSRVRSAGALTYAPPSYRPRRAAAWMHRGAVGLCVLGWAVGTAASVSALVAVGEPSWLSRYGTALLTVVLAVALAYRCGARLAVWMPLVVLATAATMSIGLNWAYASLAVVAAVVASVLAVMITRPASTALGVVAEYALAVVVAASGGVSVAAWNASLSTPRFDLVVLALALLLTLTAVWGLGTGLHGLGRRGFGLIVGAAVLLALILAYGTAVRAYGSPAVIQTLDDVVDWLHAHLGGVPRPAQVLVGFPALVCGIAARASRRQGWWVCVFGVVATSSVATSLASRQADPVYIGLSTLYSVVLGLAVGLVVRRFVRLSGNGSGRRVQRDEPLVARPEPARTDPLT